MAAELCAAQSEMSVLRCDKKLLASEAIPNPGAWKSWRDCPRRISQDISHSLGLQKASLGAKQNEKKKKGEEERNKKTKCQACDGGGVLENLLGINVFHWAGAANTNSSSECRRFWERGRIATEVLNLPRCRPASERLIETSCSLSGKHEGLRWKNGGKRL